VKSGLPIDAVVPELLAALRTAPSVVLQAPPGAGKSTVLPLVLLDEPWMQGKRMLMLEPRRLAARAVAQRMAQTLRESVGRTVGYRMRMDTRVSRDTRIEVVTEGVLTRMLQNDPALEGVGIVIFDEFHERSLQADLGLALTVDGRDSLSSDLKILVMSATLDGEGVARLLGNAPIVTAQGRAYPVESRFLGKGLPILPQLPGAPWTPGVTESPEKVTAQLVSRALREEHGDILVFLPGAREIRRVQSLVESAGLDPATRLLPLFGDLSADDQDAALAPAPRGSRKVVLATNIAETSLTIEGVRVVVDSGLVRKSVFDPATGMSRLETQRISRASADQRQGRAGRLEPGVSYRAWSEGAHRSLAAFSAAEIVAADLVPLALELASWGIRHAADLRWLDPPPAAQLASARELLSSLGALDDAGRITAHGREMSAIGVHPRLAHMLLRARDIGCLPLAADIAALLSERDVLRGSSSTRDADVTTRVELMRGDGIPAGIDRFSLQRARRVASDLQRQVGNAVARPVTAASTPSGAAPTRRSSSGAIATAPASLPAPSSRLRTELLGVLLAFAFPDRIGRRRSEGTPTPYTLANGRGAHFADVQSLAKYELIVAIDLDDRDRDARILLAAPLTRSELDEFMPERIQRSESVEWNSRQQAVIARRVVQLGAIMLEEKPLPSVPSDAARVAMLEGVRELGVEALPWTRDARDLQARIGFARPGGSEASAWPDVSDAALTASLESWLPAWLDGITRRDHLARLSMTEILNGLLTWEQKRALEQLAPTHLQVPSGSNIRIDYLDDSAPVVAVRLQEVFGLQESPRIGGARIPITFKLLSPAQRPVQVTRDLAGFWRGSYAEVRKEMRGRYTTGPRTRWMPCPVGAPGVVRRGLTGLQPDDDLAQEVVRLHQIVSRLRILEVKDLVHDGLQLVFRDEGIHRFEVLPRPHVDAAHRDVGRQQRKRRHIPAEPAQAADQGNMPAGRKAGQRMRQRVLAADFQHFQYAGSARQRPHRLVPVRRRPVVDGSDGAERPGARQLVITRAGDDRLCTRRHRELQTEYRHPACAFQQHVIAGLHPAARHEAVPGSHRRTGQRRAFLVRQMRWQRNQALFTQRYVLRQHPVDIAA
jgi:ATP-dependent helicase HrpB